MKQANDLSRLRARIERFAKKKQIKLTGFGRRALNTPNFVERLDQAIKGKMTLRPSTLAKARSYLDANGG